MNSCSACKLRKAACSIPLCDYCIELSSSSSTLEQNYYLVCIILPDSHSEELYLEIPESISTINTTNDSKLYQILKLLFPKLVFFTISQKKGFPTFGARLLKYQDII